MDSNRALKLPSPNPSSFLRWMNSKTVAAAKGWPLKDAFVACRDKCDQKYLDFPIYEHCLPFNVARAYDEANGIDHPRIWTAQRDQEMWEALQQ